MGRDPTVTSARYRAHQYLNYYGGTVRQIVVQCIDGATVQFLASLLTQFVAVNGIHGDFVLTCEEDFKGSELRRH